MLSWHNQCTVPPFTWTTWRKQRKYLYVWDSLVQIQIDWLRQWIIHVTIMPTLAGSQNLKTVMNMNHLNLVWNFHKFSLTKPFLMYASYIPAAFHFLDLLVKCNHITFRAISCCNDSHFLKEHIFPEVLISLARLSNWKFVCRCWGLYLLGALSAKIFRKPIRNKNSIFFQYFFLYSL
jgi:hypothetical protein